MHASMQHAFSKRNLLLLKISHPNNVKPVYTMVCPVRNTEIQVSPFRRLFLSPHSHMSSTSLGTGRPWRAARMLSTTSRIICHLAS